MLIYIQGVGKAVFILPYTLVCAVKSYIDEVRTKKKCNSRSIVEKMLQSYSIEEYHFITVTQA